MHTLAPPYIRAIQPKMIHNHERLLIKLVEQYYGLLPSSVAKVLLNHGAISLKRAIKKSVLNRQDFEKGLNVLIRCGFVFAKNQLERLKIFEIDGGKIINILYYPHYLISIKKRFGIESVSLVKTLFLYGQLSVNDLIERTLYNIIQANSLQIGDEQMRLFIDSLHEKVQILLNKNIITYQDTKFKNSSVYDQNLIFDSLKKSLNPTEETNNSCNLITTTSSLHLNVEALNHLYFIELFPYLLNPPFMNAEANFVFNLLLEMTFEKSSKHQTITVLSFQPVFERYHAQYPQISITKLPTVLTIFSHYFAPDFIRVGKLGCALDFEAFLINWVKIIVKEFIKKNFGENSVRIFGALLEGVCVFEQNLLTTLKIDNKELHRNLYILDQNRLINISFFSEANQTSIFASRNVKKAFSVDLNDVVDCILKRCYYSIYTLLHRHSIEINSQKDLISRKNHIENYKKEFEEKVLDEEQKNYFIKTAHNYMSEADHKRAEALLSYDEKVDKIIYHLVNHIFVLNFWKAFSSLDKNNDQQQF